MPEPTHADILAAIQTSKDEILDGQRKIVSTQQEIIHTLAQIQDSEHGRGLGLAERVERIERHLNLV